MTDQPLRDAATVRLAAADPIDRYALADRIAPLADDVIAEILAAPMLVAAPTLAAVPTPDRAPSRTPAARPQAGRRARHRWQPAAAACVALMMVGAVLVGLLGTSDRAYAITVDNGVVVVNWVRDLRDGSEIGRDLRGYGVDATVRTVSASPSQVGRILTVSINGVEAGEMPPGVSWGADGTDEVFTWRIDPATFTDSIDIELGVEPAAGEPYVSANSGFAPGEVLGGLHCALREPVTAAAVDRQLRRLDLDARWYRVTETPASSEGDLAAEVLTGSAPAGTVIDVQPLDARTVRVAVAPPGARLTAPIFTPVRPAAECTPELASRWVGVI